MPSFGFGLRRSTFALLATLPCLAQEADMAERLYSSGERAYATKAYGEAADTWNQLIQQAPKSPFAAMALLRLARHQLEVERKEEAALPLLEKIKAEHLRTPWAAQALLLRGEILAGRSRGPQDLKEAMGEFNRVLDLFPGHPAAKEAHYRLGLAFRLQSQWGRALQHFTEAIRLDPDSPAALRSRLQAADVLDIMGDLGGCLRMLQDLRNRFPQSQEGQEAAWRIEVRVKQRILKPPFKSQGPWPGGRQKWLKTPTALGVDPAGGLYVYQDDLDRVFRVKDGQLEPVGPTVKGARALLFPAPGQVWVLSAKAGGIVKEDGSPLPLGAPLQAPVGAFRDGWGSLWIADAKAGAIQVAAPEGAARTIPAPGVAALAPLPSGGAAAAADGSRSLLFLDASGQAKATVPYGKDLPAGFKYVVAMASDALGHVAAIVDGDFEGVALWGPDGSLLRSATFKALGISGKFRALALDRQGGLILADRTNDLMIRLD
jgi:TolA-binding protein